MEEEEERSRRLAANAARERSRRDMEEEEERSRRLAANAARERSRREEEDENQRSHRRMLERARYGTRSASSAHHGVARGGSHVDRLYIGAMDSQCSFCDAFQFRGESINCCHSGKVSFPTLRPIPVTIYNLLTADTEEARHFREHIRLYNSSLAFASMGANLDVPPGHGPYCYRIHGQIYHWSGPLHPEHEQRRQYSQLYILEGNQAVQECLQHPNNVSCRERTMQSLLTAIEDVSPYACAYRRMAEVELEETLRAEERRQPKPVTMFFKRGHDQRKYNSPLQDEIAVVFVGEDGAPPGFTNRDVHVHVVVHPRGWAGERISILSANCDPMLSCWYRVKEGSNIQTSLFCVCSHQIHNVFHVCRCITDLKFYVCRH